MNHIFLIKIPDLWTEPALPSSPFHHCKLPIFCILPVAWKWVSLCYAVFCWDVMLWWSWATFAAESHDKNVRLLLSFPLNFEFNQLGMCLCCLKLVAFMVAVFFCVYLLGKLDMLPKLLWQAIYCQQLTATEDAAAAAASRISLHLWRANLVVLEDIDMALGTIYPLKVTIIAAVGTMVGVLAAVMGFSAERKRNTVSCSSYLHFWISAFRWLQIKTS